MIVFTEKARQQLGSQEQAGKFLRIYVTSGGCAGMTYNAELDSKKLDNDQVIQCEGELVVVSNQESVSYLKGLVVDYSDDLISAGFRFTNASNESSCGCGASFALAGFPALAKKEVPCGS